LKAKFGFLTLSYEARGSKGIGRSQREGKDVDLENQYPVRSGEISMSYELKL
jgi:hypothetical protein